MNIYIRQIADLLECSEERAVLVYSAMDCDFSECSKREFESEARLADAVLGMPCAS